MYCSYPKGSKKYLDFEKNSLEDATKGTSLMDIGLQETITFS